MSTKKIKKKVVAQPTVPTDEDLGLQKAEVVVAEVEAETSVGTSSIANAFGILPIGLVAGDSKLDKSYELRDFDGDMEMALARYRDKNQNIDHSKFVTYLMGMALQRLGPHDFASIESIEKELILGGMYMADILHMYIHFRMESIGHDLPMKVQCPHCRNEMGLQGDLTSLETKTVMGLDGVRGTVTLSKPISFLHGDNEIDVVALELMPAKWSVLKADDGVGAQYKALVSLVQDCVVPGGGDLPSGLFFTDFLFGKLSKRDIETIKGKILEITPGPSMVMDDITCDRTGCNRTFSFPLEWTYDAFFSISSR